MYFLLGRQKLTAIGGNSTNFMIQDKPGSHIRSGDPTGRSSIYFAYSLGQIIAKVISKESFSCPLGGRNGDFEGDPIHMTAPQKILE